MIYECFTSDQTVALGKIFYYQGGASARIETTGVSENETIKYKILKYEYIEFEN